MRVAMYWHNGRSLGHTAETAKIAHALVKDLPTAALAGLSGAYRGLDLLPEQMDVVKLPAFVNYDRSSGWALSGRQGLDGPSLFRARAELCDVFLRHYAPEVFIVNHLPRGAEDELATALARDRVGKRVLTLRGVLFDREKTAREYFGPEPSRWIGERFDAIYVHTDPKVFNLEDAYDIPTHLRSRIRYTGYLASPLPLSRAEVRQKIGVAEGERLVVASMGGGQGALPIWRALLDALIENRDAFDRAHLVAGPYLEAKDRATLSEVIATLPWARLVSYEPDMAAWMAGADLVIGAAGSNMLGEILANGCNAIAIPRQVREPEQHIHSTLLAERRLVRACGLESVLAGGLGPVVAEALREPHRPQSDLLMNGAHRYAQYLTELTGRAS
ncbi:Hypothetical protein A7982_01293 [Minicystis rosea]|nr:Hypothetical protein A7982_01293 [Minicystis rosea]